VQKKKKRKKKKGGKEGKKMKRRKNRSRTTKGTGGRHKTGNENKGTLGQSEKQAGCNLRNAIPIKELRGS